jgi:hypothetical protein
MAASLKLLPGSTVRWRGRRYWYVVGVQPRLRMQLGTSLLKHLAQGGEVDPHDFVKTS